MIEKKLKIEGMSCGHCVMSVKNELNSVKGLKVKEVKIGSAIVELEDFDISADTLKHAVEEAGYKIISIN